MSHPAPASGATSRLAVLSYQPVPCPQAATVHGDVTAFAFLIALFAVGAVVTGLLYPRRKPAGQA